MINTRDQPLLVDYPQRANPSRLFCIHGRLCVPQNEIDLKCEKPERTAGCQLVKLWISDALETIRGCVECTDRDVFKHACCLRHQLVPRASIGGGTGGRVPPLFSMGEQHRNCPPPFFSSEKGLVAKQ